MDMLRTGVFALARGARRGNSALAAFGAAAVLVGWARRRRRAGPRLLYSRTLRPGEALRLRLLAPGEDPETPV